MKKVVTMDIANRRKFFLTAIGVVLMVAMLIYASGCANEVAHNSEENSSNASTNTQSNGATDANTSNSAVSEAESELLSPTALEVTNFGWTLSAEGYVNFAVAIRNPNNYVEAMAPSITIATLDKDNNKITEERTLISAIRPQQTYEVSYIANKDAQASPDVASRIVNVTVAVTVADDGWGIYDPNDEDITTETEYVVTEQAVVPSDVDGVNAFTGKVSINTEEGQAVTQLDDETVANGAFPSYVNVILYGENEQIVGGYYDVYDVPLNGDPIDYSIYAFNAPQYANYKVFVHPYDYIVK